MILVSFSRMAICDILGGTHMQQFNVQINNINDKY